ncbi:MAG: type 1 glutamine amidotransferase [Pseudomonadota bacterium]|nr:type 1 glutamine amidotransferase [Pseudomonadota bacterium]
MAKQIDGKRVAILTTVGFEEVELTHPLQALREAGAQVSVVAPEGPTVRAWNQTDWSIEVPVDLELADASADKFDALLLPGGVINPDKLRLLPKAVELVKDFFKAGKPVFAICHGPQILIEAGVVEGRTLTSWPSLKTDLKNAGANWVDQDAVVDGQLLTSRKPDDLPAFIAQAVTLLQGTRA